MRFNQVRELAEERVAILVSENDMSVSKAEFEAIRWAKREHGVTLMVVFDAASELPLSGLEGRVLWPVPSYDHAVLNDDEQLDCLSVAALRIANKYRGQHPPEVIQAFEEAVFMRLASEERLAAADVARFLGKDIPGGSAVESQHAVSAENR